MPWKVRKRKSKYCVEKTDGSEVPGGCHDTQEEANAHQRALYAGEKGGAIVGDGWSVALMPTFPMSVLGATVYPVPAMTNIVPLTWGALPTYASDNTKTIGEVLGSVTVTVGGEDAPAVEEASSETRWQALLAFEGKPTDDRRLLMKDLIEHRELPLSIMSQTETGGGGHEGARLAARVDEIWWQESETEEGIMEIWGRGAFDSGEAGQEALRLIEGEFLTGISIDFAPKDFFLLDPNTLEPVDEKEIDIFDALMGDYVTGMSGSIMGATFVPFPAFADARVEVITAGGKIQLIDPTLKVAVLTASAAGMAPIDPPQEWFEMPEAGTPTPLTITDDGRVYGHLAVWGECHAGFSNACRLAPRSASDYSFFHLGEIKTAEGARVPVGKITVGEKGHAPISANAAAAIEHYDNTGCAVAFVRARDGQHGIWLSGAVRSDAPAEKVRDMMANPPSGDWRMAGGSLELQGVLSVVIPGFPVPRSEYHLVASSSGEEHVEALVATGYGEAPMGPRAFARKRGILRARLSTALGLDRRERTRAEIRASLNR